MIKKNDKVIKWIIMSDTIIMYHMPEGEEGVRASIRMPKTVINQVDQIAEQLLRSRSSILMEAIIQFLEVGKIPEYLLDQLDELASTSNKSVKNLIIDAIQEKLDREKEAENKIATMSNDELDARIEGILKKMIAEKKDKGLIRQE